MPTIADVILCRLNEAGVGFIFGMPGGGSNLDLIAAAGRASVPFVLAATETGAALAAVAQAEVSGRPGVCLTTLGPGVASVVNGVACARLERAPLLVLTDSHAASTGGVFEHQRLDHRALLAPVTKSDRHQAAAAPVRFLRRRAGTRQLVPDGGKPRRHGTSRTRRRRTGSRARPRARSSRPEPDRREDRSLDLSGDAARRAGIGRS